MASVPYPCAQLAADMQPNSSCCDCMAESLRSRLVLIFLPTVLGSPILEPDLDLSFRQTDPERDVRLLLGGNVSVGDVVLLQLSLLTLVVHAPVLLARSRLTCKSHAFESIPT